MKFLFALTFLFSMSAFANDISFCTRTLQIKTLQEFINKEIGGEYEFVKEQQSFVSKINANTLSLINDEGFVGAEGYVGECSGGYVWGRLAIKTTDKVLKNGLCEIKDIQSGGLCED